MSKRLILILALAFVVGISFAAYAEVQNVKVSGDLLIRGVNRENLTLQGQPTTATGSRSIATYESPIQGLLSTIRLRVDADLTDNVSTTVRLLNERDWDEEVAIDTDIDLDLAYVTLKEFLYSPLSLTLGRQEIRFGNGLIIGDPDTNGTASAGTNFPASLNDLSSRKAFDALRATLNYDPLVIDVIYAKIDENSIDLYDDVNLYGANLNYALNKDITTEAYYFERMRKKDFILTQNVGKDEVTRVLGARAQYTGIKNLTVGLESAYQWGSHLRVRAVYPDEALDNGTSREVQAFAMQSILNYALPDVKYSPALRASYTYLSGDKYLSISNKFKGWSPMFEDQAGGTIFNKILGYSNAQLINLTGSAVPLEDIKLSLDYYHLRLLNPYTNQATAGGAVTLSGIAGDPTYDMQANEKHLGDEVDITLTYDYTEDVQFGLSGGLFLPGNAFATNNDKTATQVIGSMKVTF